MSTTNNPKGRKKGVPNKTTAETKTILKNFLDFALEDMVKHYNSLGNREKVSLVTRLMPYIMPKALEETDKSEETDNTINIVYHGPNGVEKLS